MKLARLQRILRLVTILQSDRCYSPAELADELSVTRRTVFRDLNMLQQAGIPCYHDEEKGGYRIDDTFFLPPLDLTVSEALALLLVAQNNGRIQGLPLQQKARQAAIKIESALPTHIREHCGQTLRATSVRLSPLAKHDQLEKTFTLLQQAIRRRRKVKIVYASLYEKNVITTNLDPYHLHFSQRAWYIIGHSELHDENRTFKLSRIQLAELLSTNFVPAKPFRIEEYLGNAWALMPEGRIYHIKLLFSKMVARNVAEVLWHRTQKTTWQKDDTLLFEADVDGLTEISWWIMRYADQVEVIEPAALRRRVAQMAHNTARLYSNDSPTPTETTLEPTNNSHRMETAEPPKHPDRKHATQAK